MKKNFSTRDAKDIDLLELLLTIWDEKIKIALITLIISAIVISYNYSKPNRIKV